MLPSLSEVITRGFGGGFLDKDKVTERVIYVTKHFEKVDPAKVGAPSADGSQPAHAIDADGISIAHRDHRRVSWACQSLGPAGAWPYAYVHPSGDPCACPPLPWPFRRSARPPTLRRT